MGLQRLFRGHIAGDNLRAQRCEGDMCGLMTHLLTCPPHQGQASVDHMFPTTQTAVEKAGVKTEWMGAVCTHLASISLALAGEPGFSMITPSSTYMEGGVTMVSGATVSYIPPQCLHQSPRPSPLLPQAELPPPQPCIGLSPPHTCI